MKALLFGNVGTAANCYYHVGDEAIFLSTYQWYQKNFPHFKLSSFSSIPNHQSLKLSDNDLPSEFFYINRSKFFLLLLKTIFLKYFHFNFFNKSEKIFVNIVLSQDIIHFVGGGNINSFNHPWLYLSYFLIFLSKLFKKKIYITSSSLGPFLKLDTHLSSFFLNFVDQIISRESLPQIIKNQLTHPKYFVAPDIARFINAPKKSSRKSKYFCIGISIHQIKDIDTLINKLTKFINNLNISTPIKLISLPHIIVNDNQYYDIFQIKKLFKNVNPSIKKELLSSKRLLKNKNIIKYILNQTKKCDLVLATRYHSLIFSQIYNIPCYCFYSDDYYRQKFIGALKYSNPKFSNYKFSIDKFYKLPTPTIKNYLKIKSFLNPLDTLKKLY